MKLSIVIPCYNAADTISAQLEALANQQWSEPWEVVVVDNRSTDESMAIVESYRERLSNLRIVEASERQGQPYALNIGVKAARGEAVAFCDADDEVGPGWVAAMGRAVSRYDFVASRTETEKLNTSAVTKGRGNPQEDGLQKIWYPPYLPHAGGGTIGVRRSLFEEIGGFDESLPYLHDTDLCFRVQLVGTKLHFVREAVMHIRYRDTYSGIYRQARNYAEYNILVSKRYRPPMYTNGLLNLGYWKHYVGKWIRLLRLLSQTNNKAGRARWVWSLGWQIGRLKGSMKHRVPPI